MKVSKLQSNDIRTNNLMYEKYINVYHMEDGWLPGNKQKNFESMARITEFTGVPISGASCLDVGCGTGDLSLFLRKRGAKNYLGLDIFEPSLEEARKKYPYEKFILSDVLSFHSRTKYHYAFCSGALTVNLNIDNYDFLESTVVKMWNHVKTGLVFNVLTNNDRDQDHELFYYDPERVLAICRNIDQSAQIRIEETENDYQIHVYMYK